MQVSFQGDTSQQLLVAATGAIAAIGIALVMRLAALIKIINRRPRPAA
jgi:hypothetical protein